MGVLKKISVPSFPLLQESIFIVFCLLLSSCNLFYVPKSEDYSIYGKLVNFDCTPVSGGELLYATYRESRSQVCGGPASWGCYHPHVPTVKTTPVQSDGTFTIMEKSSSPISIFSQEIQSHTIHQIKIIHSMGTLEDPVRLYAYPAGVVHYYNTNPELHLNSHSNTFLSIVGGRSHQAGIVYSPYVILWRYTENSYDGSIDTPVYGKNFRLDFTLTKIKRKYALTIHGGPSIRLAKTSQDFSKSKRPYHYTERLMLYFSERDMNKTVKSLAIKVKFMNKGYGNSFANVIASMVLLSSDTIAKISPAGMYQVKTPGVYGEVSMNGVQVLNNSYYREYPKPTDPLIPSGYKCGGPDLYPPVFMHKPSLEDVLVHTRKE